MTPESEFSALKALARAIAGEAVDCNAPPDERLLELAVLHGVAPLLESRSMASGAGGPKRRPGHSTLRQAAADLALQRSTIDTLDRLADGGIPVLLLKGAPIAYLHYPSAYLRPRCDVDLYVREVDRERTAELLASAGYALFGERRSTITSKQFVATQRAPGPMALHFDIHWKLSNRTLFADTLPFEECWENRQPVSSLGENAWALSDIDLLLHACIHRIAHGRGIERNRLIWLYDIHLLWKALDEEAKAAFVEKALDRKIGAVCADALRICGELFGSVATDVAPTGGTPPSPRGSDVSRDCGATYNQEPTSGLKVLLQEAPPPPRGDAPHPCGSDVSRDAHAPAHDELTPWLARLNQNRRREPTARLIEAGKLRWAWADLVAVPGISKKFAYAKELVLKK